MAKQKKENKDNGNSSESGEGKLMKGINAVNPAKLGEKAAEKLIGMFK